MRFRNCLVLILALTLLTGFAAGPAAAGKKDGTLNIALEKELETLDWYFNTAREDIVLSQHAYDFLNLPRPGHFRAQAAPGHLLEVVGRHCPRA
jgi:hypothetical protein